MESGTRDILSYQLPSASAQHASASHTPTHRQRSLLGRPEQPFRTGLCFTADVFYRHAFSEIPRPIALKLCHMVGNCMSFINWLQKFGGLSPQKIWGQKHAKFRSILDHFRLWSRISPESGNISKIRKTYELGKFLVRLMKKVRWTLVH